MDYLRLKSTKSRAVQDTARNEGRANIHHGMTAHLERGERLPLIDALRVIALLGILQVNIQSFVWGGSDPLGLLMPDADWADTLTYLLVAALMSSKAMALFAFLFGYGFALQMKALRGHPHAYHRRLWFLLVIGLLHGCLLYFGDILAAYSVCGFILLRYAHDRPTELTKSVRRWWLGFALSSGGLLLIVGVLQRSFESTNAMGVIPDTALLQHDIYTTGGYLDQLISRIPRFLGNLTSGAPQYVPMVTSLFLLGALAARLGWLRYPHRHPQVWRVATRVGSVGLALSCAGALLGYTASMQAPGATDYLHVLLTIAGLITTALYVAIVVRYQNRPAVRRAILWLAPAGRMPLTNYLLQSVVMGALLSGWGLGWGATLSRSELAGLGIAIVAVQVLISRMYVRRFGSGPLETLWRRVTYSGQNTRTETSATARG